MSNCKKCGKNIPARVIIDGKKRNLCRRKYCFDCSPFGQHNTRQLNKALPIRICRRCGKEYNGGHRKYKALCSSCKVVLWRLDKKQKGVELLGGKCQYCGYNKCIHNLHFHHLDPSQKEFQISGSTLGWERIKKEIQKCVLLCSNCHTELEYNIITL